MGEDGMEPRQEMVDEVHSLLPPAIIESQTEELDQDDDRGTELRHRQVKAIGSVSSEENMDEFIDYNNENTTSINSAKTIVSAPASASTSRGQLANLQVRKKRKREVIVIDDIDEWSAPCPPNFFSSPSDGSFRNEWFKMRTFNVEEGAAATGAGESIDGGQTVKENGAAAGDTGGKHSTSCLPWWLKGKTNIGEK
ncbi:uncharacterized protein LOC116192173 [Punica granatum]|uniref:Uncharacterized protein n=2 Tax=Punica granatum TaxID=22663 RepID=A0A218X9D8_PUNGR|nr:uncharacterized protein LOC116192173 [Punica granatum]OWM81309.1 hypothetical protein CDL15_Pgr007347 [Punica granatum]PKI67750.1 hypothetical protein CRG98_011963 [Punica granatum]